MSAKLKGGKSKRGVSKIDSLNQKIHQLKSKNREYENQIENTQNEADKLKELYQEEREKNDDLIQHLNHS